MKLLSVAYKFITASLICQAVMLSPLFPARPLPKSPAEQALAQQAIKTKLEKLGTKLGDLKKNLGNLKQKLQNLKSTLPKGATTPATPTAKTSTSPSTPGETPTETDEDLDNVLKNLITLKPKKLANKLAKMAPKKLNRLSERIGTTPAYQDLQEYKDLKKAIDEVLASKPKTSKSSASSETSSEEDLMEALKKRGGKPVKFESTSVPESVLNKDEIIKKPDVEQTKELEEAPVSALLKLDKAILPEVSMLTKAALEPEDSKLLEKIAKIIKTKKEQALKNLPVIIDQSDEKLIRKGISQISSGDDLDYAFRSEENIDTLISLINIDTQPFETLYKFVRAVVNDTTKEVSTFILALHKKIIDAWLTNLQKALLKGPENDAIKYLTKTIDLCNENRSSKKQNKVDFLANPQAEFGKIFAQITDNKRAQTLAEAGHQHVQDIIKAKTGK